MSGEEIGVPEADYDGKWNGSAPAVMRPDMDCLWLIRECRELEESFGFRTKYCMER